MGFMSAIYNMGEDKVKATLMVDRAVAATFFPIVSPHQTCSEMQRVWSKRHDYFTNTLKCACNVHAMEIEMGKKGRCTHARTRRAGNDRRDLFHFTIIICTLGSVSFVYFVWRVVKNAWEWTVLRLGARYEVYRSVWNFYYVFVVVVSVLYPPILRCVYNEINDHTTHKTNKR